MSDADAATVSRRELVQLLDDVAAELSENADLEWRVRAMQVKWLQNGPLVE